MSSDIFDRRKTRNEAIAGIMRIGYDRDEAEFILSVGWGEISGDLRKQDANGNEVPVKRRYLDEPTRPEIFKEMGI